MSQWLTRAIFPRLDMKKKLPTSQSQMTGQTTRKEWIPEGSGTQGMKKD